MFFKVNRLEGVSVPVWVILPKKIKGLWRKIHATILGCHLSFQFLDRRDAAQAHVGLLIAVCPEPFCGVILHFVDC